jgi:hypothetical protein
MLPTVYSSTTYNDLERFVHLSLCEVERFDPERTVLKKSFLRQEGRVVGLLFRVEGNRLYRGHAVWSEPENRVLFYNSAGRRFGEVRLAESPDIMAISLSKAA